MNLQERLNERKKALEITLQQIAQLQQQLQQAAQQELILRGSILEIEDQLKADDAA